MFIENYGLFWRIDEVEWYPGKGARGAFRLLGHRRENIPALRLADFRDQRGIYILYGNHGAHYVGLTKKRGLGLRLKDHLNDRHKTQWDRFSWFGFCKVLEKKNEEGLRTLKRLAHVGVVRPRAMIGDVEALLIKAMGLDNINQMKFSNAREWSQVKAYKVEAYMKKVARGR